MPHVLIIHEVAAYPAWKAVFDNAAEMRKKAGEISVLSRGIESPTPTSPAAASVTQ